MEMGEWPMCVINPLKSSVPVNPYNQEIPINKSAEEKAEDIISFMAASGEFLRPKSKPTAAAIGSEDISSPR